MGTPLVMARTLGRGTLPYAEHGRGRGSDCLGLAEKQFGDQACHYREAHKRQDVPDGRDHHGRARAQVAAASRCSSTRRSECWPRQPADATTRHRLRTRLQRRNRWRNSQDTAPGGGPATAGHHQACSGDRDIQRHQPVGRFARKPQAASNRDHPACRPKPAMASPMWGALESAPPRRTQGATERIWTRRIPASILTNRRNVRGHTSVMAVSGTAVPSGSS